MECLVYCSCSQRETDYQRILDQPLRIHDLNSLLFCPSCQSPKCKYCYQTQYIKKYCINCTTDYSTTNELICNRKCFTCPECDSMLSIVVLDNNGGKVFKFNCGFCSYTYTTQIILKPRSIYNIIKNEYRTDNINYDFFNKIVKMHKYKLNYEILNDQIVRQVKNKSLSSTSKDLLTRLEKQGLDPSDDSNILELDKILHILSTSSPLNISHQSASTYTGLYKTGITLFNTQDFNIGNGKKFPVPKRLVTRDSIKCCDCNQILQYPSEEPITSKTISKFVTKFYANEFMPALTLTPLVGSEFLQPFENNIQYTFLVNVINPLSLSCHITLSCPESYKIKATDIQVIIPKRDLILGPYHTGDHPIRSIPTAHLTNATRISRAELSIRKSKMSIDNEDGDDTLSLVQQNDNWGCLPIKLTFKGSLPNLMIPIYVNIKSKLPNEISTLGLSKKELSFGYWVILKQ